MTPALVADRDLAPGSEAELAQVIREADGPVRLVGGGTRGMAPTKGKTVSLAGLAGIVDYVPGALTLIARAGTPVVVVEAALAGERQRLAFEPPDWRSVLGTSGTPTIGGVVAANLSGPRAVLAATPRDHLLGLRFVDGRGTVVKSGGRVMKNVTGLDVARLLCGSRGRFGAITEVALKVLPEPETTETLVARGLDAAAAVRAMSAALGTPWEVSGAARTPDGATWLRLEGFAGSVRERSGRLARHLSSHGAWEVAEVDPWHGIRDLDGLRGAGDLWLVRARPSAMPALLATAGAERALLDLGGARSVLAVAPGTDLRARPGPEVRAVRLGRPDTASSMGAVGVLEGALKAAFDPRAILNAG